ncbi:GNAT family N-acetyltransferase [Propionibacteriaceae bacterium Y1923]
MTTTENRTSTLGLSVRRLHPASPADVATVAGFEMAAIERTFGAADVRTEEQQAVMMAPTPYWDIRHYGAFTTDDRGVEAMVGHLGLSIPLNENLDMIHFDLEVVPSHRGHGVASRLVDELELARAELGRPRLTAYGTETDAAADLDDPDLPINRIAARLGMTRRNVAVARVLDLPVASTVLDDMDAEALPLLDGYRIVVWRGHPPREHWLRYGTMLTQLDLDEPDEDVELEPQHYDETRLQVAFDRQDRQGIAEIIAVAVAPDGSLVGHSELQYRDNPGTTLVWQENTLVMPEHRGHRLGLALKAATHRELQAHAPQLTTEVTWNSHVNDHMIGINEKMGYRVHLREVAFQN